MNASLSTSYCLASYLQHYYREVCVNRAKVRLILDIEMKFIFCEIFVISIPPSQKGMSPDADGRIYTLILQGFVRHIYAKIMNSNWFF